VDKRHLSGWVPVPAKKVWGPVYTHMVWQTATLFYPVIKLDKTKIFMMSPTPPSWPKIFITWMLVRWSVCS